MIEDCVGHRNLSPDGRSRPMQIRSRVGCLEAQSEVGERKSARTGRGTISSHWLRNYLKKAAALFPPSRPQRLLFLGAHPPDPLPEGSAPLDSPDGILRYFLVFHRAQEAGASIGGQRGEVRVEVEYALAQVVENRLGVSR